MLIAQAIGQNQLAQEQNQLAQEVEIIARRPGTANGIPTSAGIVGTVWARPIVGPCTSTEVYLSPQ